MRRATLCSAALLIAAGVWSQASFAQLDLSGIKIAEPAPEQPGDRAMSCSKIADEMGEIMRKRGVHQKIAASKTKICSSRKEIDRLGEERKKLSATQVPALQTAAIVGGPVATAVTRKTQAEDAALNAKQAPDRDRALAGISSGIGDMMEVMNDPRLMRLSMLAEEKQCGQELAPPQQSSARTPGDGCDDEATENDTPGKSAVPATPGGATTPAGAADPFAQRSTTKVKPAAQDPFAPR